MNKRYKPWPPRRPTDAQDLPSKVSVEGTEPERARLGLFGIRRRKPAEADPGADGKPSKFGLQRLVAAVVR